ncbi:MAG TPA: methyltransferase domain-containing protein [Acidimicrobiales bacterium]|nr:methyltransferase domain-containing protein [Acidimicrobiales bacterium]
MANESEIKRWNDERWATAWPARERLTESVSPYLVAAAAPRSGQRVCDIGCGGGSLSITMAQAVTPDGAVVGYDISAPLLDLARHRAEDAGAANLRFVETDVQSGGWADSVFDLAVSQFGVMFFDEPTAAFGAIRRNLAPGGRFVFVCWQGVERNPWHLGTALKSLLPPPRVPAPGKSPVGPFSLGDDEYVREVFEAAGYASVRGTPHETTVRAPASAVVDRSVFGLMGIPADREEEAFAMAERHLDRFAVAGGVEGDGTYEYPLAFTVYESTS